ERKERQRALLATRGDISRSLIVEGRGCRLYREAGDHAASDEAALMPWKGRLDTMIDRFDGRALLDVLPDESDTACAGGGGDEPKALEAFLNFER
ncbi:unnamed protein product, partial [Phaeothamnion confervicola]